MTMQNYMFIDIDGPLLPGKMHLFKQNKEFLAEFSGSDADEHIDRFPPLFDPYAVAVHNWLAKEGNAKIVLVTNWRMWFTIEKLQEILANQGLVFDYADRPSCIKRGLSSARLHDVSTHIEDYLPKDSRALVIDDDHGLLTLNEWFADDHKSDSNQERLRKNIEFKLLDVDYTNGLTHKQVMDGAKFFGILGPNLDSDYPVPDFFNK